MSIIFSLATDIYRIYSEEQDKTYRPEHLPQPALILFQRFKRVVYLPMSCRELITLAHLSVTACKSAF